MVIIKFCLWQKAVNYYCILYNMMNGREKPRSSPIALLLPRVETPNSFNFSIYRTDDTKNNVN